MEPGPRLIDSQESDDDDDWFFASLKRYKNLHMFDLQYPVKSLAWVNSKTMCVATRKPVGAEILELNLPEKLLAETQEDEGLCNSRDFHLPSGGLCDRHIVDIQCQPTARMVFCAHESDNSVSVWQLGTETEDVIQEMKTLKNLAPDSHPSVIGLHDNHRNKVVFGSFMSNVVLMDAETDTALNTWSSQTQASKDNSNLIGVAFQDENMILACTGQGNFSYLDVRENPRTNPTEVVNCDCNDSCAAFSVKETMAAFATRKGKIILKDLRKSGDLHTILSGLNSVGSDVCIEISPCQEDMLSLSGYDQNIYIYNYKNDTKDFIQPTFVHDAHRKADRDCENVSIWTHSWHPEQRHLLLSSGSDGSLHAWDYVEGS